MSSPSAFVPVAVAGNSQLPGPFPVGAYAAQLRRRLKEFARVQLTGEVWSFRQSRARVYFELRDAGGALPCSMWISDFERLGVAMADGLRVVVGGGCDLYPGSATSSPSFFFAVTELRVAGEGDLLAQLQQRRRQLHADGLFEPQKRLPRPTLPRTIGVITGEGGKAGEDIRAALHRRGWAGRLVWAFAPVQDRHAAPRISEALRELASLEAVEVIVVARGGGSLADLFAFCDEHLCRTVALLRVPVIASVGHHTDRTLLDDVAAVCCSTPTHAAEAAVPVDLRAARTGLRALARGLESHSRQAVLRRAVTLGHLAQAPGHHVARHRRHLHQLLRELRASGKRAREHAGERTGLHVEALQARAERARDSGRRAHQRDLERLALALGAHDPQRTLDRGYALVEDHVQEPVTSAAEAAAAGDVQVRFHDGAVAAHVRPGPAAC